MTVWIYLARNFFSNSAIVISTLVALFTFLSLSETLDDVGKGAFTTFSAFQVVALTTPNRLIDLLPVTTILGSLLTLGSMSNNRELLVMRAAGVSIKQLCYALMSFVLFASILCALLFETLIPYTEKRAHEISALTLEETTLGKNEFWSRQDSSILRVGNLQSRHIPRKIEIYETGASGELERMIEADKAFLRSNKEWLLFDVTDTIFLDDGVSEKRMDNLLWKSFLTREQFAQLTAPPITLSLSELVDYLKKNKILAIDASQYSSMLWKKVSLPFSLVAMALVAIPLTTATAKTRSGGHHVVTGGVIGIFFYLLEQTTSNLDQLLNIPSPLASLAPPLLIIMSTFLFINKRY